MSIKKFAVIGHPIGHTMSPFIHKRLFELSGVEAEYTKLDIAPENLADEYKNVLSKLDGYNITIPHKQNIIPLIDEIDEKAKMYGSVNTVANINGVAKGYTTDPDGFLHIFKLMENLFLFDTPGRDFELMSLFYGMLGKLYTSAKKQCSYPIIKAGTEYMEKNLSNPDLSNESIAKSAGVSEIYFRKLFKRQFGLTPHAYMQQIRINKAKAMLENGSTDIEGICSDCGYNNIYYFFKVFKEKTGYTPPEYRKKYYNKNL